MTRYNEHNFGYVNIDDISSYFPVAGTLNGRGGIHGDTCECNGCIEINAVIRRSRAILGSRIPISVPANSIVDLNHERIERLQAQLDEEYRRGKVLEGYGEDIYEIGTCIRFDKVLRNVSRTAPTAYAYAALKCPDGYWYTTGPRSNNKPMTWEELTTWLAGHTPCEQIWVYTEMAPTQYFMKEKR